MFLLARSDLSVDPTDNDEYHEINVSNHKAREEKGFIGQVVNYPHAHKAKLVVTQI